MFTRGDDVGFAETQEQLRTLIGTIDTPLEAKWIVEAEERAEICIQSYSRGQSEHQLTYLRCGPVPDTRDTFQVASVRLDGSMTVVARELAPPGMRYSCPGRTTLDEALRTPMR